MHDVLTRAGSYWTGHRRVFISAFILLYIYSVGLYLCPKSLWRDRLQAPVLGALRYLGLWQNFVTFAPSPIMHTLNVDAIVVYDDGTAVTWLYPRAESTSGIERIVKDKYRRVLYVYLLKERSLWPSLAKFAARQSDQPTRHPVKVQLIKHVWAVPPPVDGIGGHAIVMPVDSVFYRCDITPDDLR